MPVPRNPNASWSVDDRVVYWTEVDDPPEYDPYCTVTHVDAARCLVRVQPDWSDVPDDFWTPMSDYHAAPQGA